MRTDAAGLEAQSGRLLQLRNYLPQRINRLSATPGMRCESMIWLEKCAAGGAKESTRDRLTQNRFSSNILLVHTCALGPSLHPFPERFRPESIYISLSFARTLPIAVEILCSRGSRESESPLCGFARLGKLIWRKLFCAA